MGEDLSRHFAKDSQYFTMSNFKYLDTRLRRDLRAPLRRLWAYVKESSHIPVANALAGVDLENLSFSKSQKNDAVIHSIITVLLVLSILNSDLAHIHLEKMSQDRKPMNYPLRSNQNKWLLVCSKPISTFLASKMKPCHYDEAIRYNFDGIFDLYQENLKCWCIIY